jgi:hypothetical protein
MMPRAVCAAVLLVVFAGAAAAQQPEPPGFAPAPAAADFFPRYDFHLSAASLSGGDQRFAWDTHFGGDFDLIDYVNGRVTALVDYEAVLGTEFRQFDPNQGNYTLEAAASVRVGATEIAGVLHHVSRHLSDRSKRFPVAWNVLGVRVMRRVALVGGTMDVALGGGRLVEAARVDYTWTGNVDVLMRRPLRPHVGVYARGTSEVFGIDAAISTRRRQIGGKAEVGVRLNGNGGAVELFAGYERRVDADPLDRQPHRWALAGFRLLNR